MVTGGTIDSQNLDTLSKEELITLVEKQKQEIAILRRLHFGTSSERHVAVPESHKALELFNEAETLNVPNHELDEITQSDDQVEDLSNRSRQPKTKGSSRGRKMLSDHLSRVEIIHELDEKDRACPCCGNPRRELGQEITEELEYVPAHYVVHRNIRKTYGECSCEGFVNSGEPGVLITPLKRLIPGSSYSSSTIANIIASKYVDALPLYRQEDITERAGFRINRNTMAHLCITAANKLKPLHEMMVQDQRGSPVIRFDETTVQVLKEMGRKAQAKSQAWVSYGYKDSRPIILFRYFPGRKKEFAFEILQGYKGFAQTDGYAGYNEAVSASGAIHVGCWAHIRRKFQYALESSGGKDTDAADILHTIRTLYELERDLRIKLVDREITEEEFLIVRRRRACRIMSKIEIWLDEKKNTITPSSNLGAAINYALGQLEKAKRYVEHHLMTPDNNPIERAIRPFVTGRKNWMFSDTENGAEASMILYSFAMTAKANGLKPSDYFTQLLKDLPHAESEEEKRRLLPYNYALEKQCIPGGYFLPGENRGVD